MFLFWVGLIPGQSLVGGQGIYLMAVDFNPLILIKQSGIILLNSGNIRQMISIN